MPTSPRIHQTLIVDTDNYSLPRGAVLVVLNVGWTLEDMGAIAAAYGPKRWGWADVGDHLPPCKPMGK